MNFIRYSCQDGEWVAAQSKSAKAGSEWNKFDPVFRYTHFAFYQALKYSDISGLEQSIDAAYRAASQRIYEIFFQRYKFMDHLLAIKSYLMLGYGDFVDQLMESLGYVYKFTGLQSQRTNFPPQVKSRPPRQHALPT